MTNIAQWSDNPLLIKHIRTRLRRPALLQSIVVLLVIIGIMVFSEVANHNFPSRWFGYSLIAVQACILSFLGTNQVVSAVGRARESGILDFHRISPESPRSVAEGFFIGAPIREYLLFAITLPFMLLCVFGSQTQLRPFTWADFVLGTTGVLLISWLLHAVGMFVALNLKQLSKSWSALQVVLVILGLYLFAILFLEPMSWNAPNDRAMVRYFGFQCPWEIGIAFLSVPLTVFALIGSVRLLGSERVLALSKPQALSFVTAISASILGYFWEQKGVFILLMYILVAVGIIASIPIAPHAGEYSRGVRRALRNGSRHLPFWNDLALNRITLGMICGVLLLAGTIGEMVISNSQSLPLQIYSEHNSAESMTIAVGVLAVAAFGLGVQYFRLIAPVRSASLIVLAVFLAWVVPTIVYFVHGASGLERTQPKVSAILSGLSPLTSLSTISVNS